MPRIVSSQRLFLAMLNGIRLLQMAISAIVLNLLPAEAGLTAAIQPMSVKLENTKSTRTYPATGTMHPSAKPIINEFLSDIIKAIQGV